MPFTDAFTGSNGTVLSTYSANWGPLFSSALNEARIFSNGVGTDTFPNGNAYAGHTWANDQYSQLTFTTVAEGNQAAVVRGAASPRTGYAGGLDVDSQGHTRYGIWKYVSNVRTQLATHGSQTAQANDIVKLTVEGTTLKLFVNSVEILSTTDGDIASGMAGFLVYGTSSSTKYLDDWEGDDITVIPNSFVKVEIRAAP